MNGQLPDLGSMAITALGYDGIPVSFGLPIRLSNSGLRSPSSFLPFVAGYGLGYVLLTGYRANCWNFIFSAASVCNLVIKPQDRLPGISRSVDILYRLQKVPPYASGEDLCRGWTWIHSCRDGGNVPGTSLRL